MNKKKSKQDTISLFDQLNKVYVMIKLGQNKKWERWISDNKEKWIKTHSSLSMDDVIRIKEKIISNNYNNLYSVVIDKR